MASLAGEGVGADEPTWLGSSSLLKMTDDRVRLRAQSLVQLATTDRERVLVVHAFVKALTFNAPMKEGYQTAREVLDARGGDVYGKSTLFVALLRLAKIPARIRFVKLGGDVLRGFNVSLKTVTYPLVEVHLDGHWLKTDTHVYDTPYLASVRERLKAEQWSQGFGVHTRAHSVWDARRDAFSAFSLDDPASYPLFDLGVFDDPRRFRRHVNSQRSPVGFVQGWVGRFKWRVVRGALQRGVASIRTEIDTPSGGVADVRAH